MNPFAREPSDFYEKDFDKRFSTKKYLMPHLYATACFVSKAGLTGQELITNLESLMGKETAKTITDHVVSGNACFVQFSLYTAMGAAVRAVKATATYNVFTSGEIAEWYETETPSEKDLFESIKARLSVPKSGLPETLKTLQEAYRAIMVDKTFKSSEGSATGGVKSIVH